MKNKFNLMTIAFVGLIFFAGCTNSGGNKAVNVSNVTVVPLNANKSAQVDSKINEDNLAKMNTGMKHADVAKLLGSEGKIISENKELKRVMYVWSDESGSFIRAVFENDKLIAKDPTGLK